MAAFTAVCNICSHATTVYDGFAENQHFQFLAKPHPQQTIAKTLFTIVTMYDHNLQAALQWYVKDYPCNAVSLGSETLSENLNGFLAFGIH